MPLIDAKSVWLKAQRRRQAADEQRERVDKRKAREAVEETETPKKGGKKKRNPLTGPNAEQTCKRIGCNNPREYNWLCKACYDELTRGPSENYGVKDDVPMESRFNVGQYCLISQAHVTPSLRGCYCKIARLSPKGEVATVELTGESTDDPIPAKVIKRTGEQLNVFVCWLLAVDEDTSSTEE